ncbi:hypothetical protein [Micromonospora haikouensis]|uniref:hypothetical protein n=1 Tax=Micromonospora haikouensis TaxID=686309 RepID=UPI0037A103A6
MRAPPRLAVLVTFSLAILPACDTSGIEDRPTASVGSGAAAAAPDTAAAERPEGLADHLPELNPRVGTCLLGFHRVSNARLAGTTYAQESRSRR